MHEMRENVTSDVCFGVFKGFANNDTEFSSQKYFLCIQNEEEKTDQY